MTSFSFSFFFFFFLSFLFFFFYLSLFFSRIENKNTQILNLKEINLKRTFFSKFYLFLSLKIDIFYFLNSIAKKYNFYSVKKKIFFTENYSIFFSIKKIIKNCESKKNQNNNNFQNSIILFESNNFINLFFFMKNFFSELPEESFFFESYLNEEFLNLFFEILLKLKNFNFFENEKEKRLVEEMELLEKIGSLLN